MQLDEIQFIGVPAYSYLWLFDNGTTSTAQNPQHLCAAAGAHTATLIVSDGTAAVTNTVTVNAQPLRLTMGPIAAGKIKLSWPTWAQNCRLYSATNLVSPINWMLVTNPVTTAGTNDNLTIPIGADNRFFQLRSP